MQWEYNAGTIAHFKLWTNFHLQLATYFWGSIGSYERDGLPLFRFIALDYPAEAWAYAQQGGRVHGQPAITCRTR